MQDDSRDKYKMFRNYMTNELGITRNDIEAWCKEAVASEVARLVGQMNVHKAVTENVKDQIQAAIFRSSYGREMSEDVRKLVREAIAAEIAGRITFSNPTPKG